MTRYVLEILDGDRAQETVLLSGEPVTFGRRSGNTVVLTDEKVSGHHATVVEEDGSYVLRDLDSTNGTLMEGRRVAEVVLSPNDIIQLGRIRLMFREEGAPSAQAAAAAAASDQLHVHAVDKARLARSGRGRGGVGLVLLLVLVLAAGAVWYFKFGGNETTGRSRVKVPPRIVDNLLKAGVDNVETDEGWDLTVSGASFGKDRGHTGRSALMAEYGTSETGTAHKYGLARTTARLMVSPGQGLLAQAYLRTAGQARAALRLRFSSSVAEDSQSLFSGTAPQSCQDYQKVELRLAVPPGFDHVQVEVLALLPGEGARVWADDLALLSGTEAVPVLDHKTRNGTHFYGSGQSVAVRASQQTVLYGIRPVVSEESLLALDRAGLLCLSDAGLELEVEKSDAAVSFGIKASPEAPSQGVRLDFPADLAAAGVLVRKGEEAFASHGNKFDLLNVRELLLGYGPARLMLRLSQPAALQGKVLDRTFQLQLPAGVSFSLVAVFGEERRRARELLTKAEGLQKAGDFSQVLDLLDELLSQSPHVDDQANEARNRRAGLLEQLDRRLKELRMELDRATVFATRGGFLRVKNDLAQLTKTYGRQHLPQPELVKAMEERVQAALADLDLQEGRLVRKKLGVLVSVFEEAGQKELHALVSKYMQEYLPPPEPEPAAGTEKPGKSEGEGEGEGEGKDKGAAQAETKAAKAEDK